MEDATILCVTHSSRRFLEARCSINALEKRFAAKQTATPPPFESFPPIHDAVPFSGALSLWKFDRERNKLAYLRKYDPGYKIQSAAFHHDRLLVYGHDRLEVLDLDFRVLGTVSDPWIAGGHTVYVDGNDHAWLTTAPGNAIMRVDLNKGSVVERIAMPAEYGRSYELTPEHNLHEHFISTDYQPTHVNCAFPAGGKIYVTLWVPGVVGCFDAQRNYRELVRGYRGCHGGKIDQASGDVYLTDSPSGIIWFFDPQTGAIRKRLKLDSLWLHDAEQVGGDVYAAGLSDKNELLLLDKNTGDVLDRAECSALGQSVMFVSSHRPSPAWMERLGVISTEKPTAAVTHEVLGPDCLPALEKEKNPIWVSEHVAMHAEGSLTFASAKPLKYDYVFKGAVINLPAGKYVFTGKVDCRQGGMSIGLIDTRTDTWVTQMTFDQVNHAHQQVVTLPAETPVQCIIAACNTMGPNVVWSVITELSLRRVLSKPQTLRMTA